jgi:7,8-dihydropterin-6-yl-methyl-4-(beta-D-ribofuranosyl)aminobenzene 5'-phosphate synthase
MGLFIVKRDKTASSGSAGRRSVCRPVTAIIAAAITAMGVFLIAGCGGAGKEVPMRREPRDGESGSGFDGDACTVTVLFDNNRYTDGLTTSWGFSCVVQYGGETVLFDTGGSGSILLENMEALGIDPAGIDVVVLSHAHGDHVGGLGAFLEKNPEVSVFLPASFPADTKSAIRGYGADVVDVLEPCEIRRGLRSTGELGTAVREQSMVIETGEGLVIVTGCAHPGIVEIVSKAKELFGGDVLLVMGGFHLGGTNARRLGAIVSEFKRLGVAFAGPCHCSGDEARRLFSEAYGDKFIEVGVGKVIEVGDLCRQSGSAP